MTRPDWRIFLAAILAIVVLYGVVGASVGGNLVRGQLHQRLAGTSDQTLALDYLRFNPFTLTARFEGLRLSDINADPVMTVKEGHLRLAFSALVGNSFTVTDLLLQQPSLYIAITGSGGDRRLRSLGSLHSPAGSGEKPGSIQIVHAKVYGGHVTVLEAADVGTGSALVSTQFSEVELELSDWISDATTPASFDLTATVNELAALNVQGVWVPASHTIEADINLNDLELTPFATLFDAWLADVQLAGVLAAHGQFRRNADSAGFDGELTVEQLSIDDTTGQSVFSADTFAAHGVKIGSGRSPATVKWVEMERPGVVLHLDANGQFNLRSVILGTVPRVDKATVRDGLISFTDARLPSIVHVEADKIAGEIKRTIGGQQETLALSLAGDVLPQGAATLDGVFRRNAGQLEAEGDATISGVDAGIVSAYFSSLTAREIDEGMLQLDLHYRVEGPELAISSKIVLSDFELSAPLGESPAFDLPLDLTIALLTDANHQMAFELPVTIATIDSGDALRQAFNTALTGFVNTTTAESLNIIARLAHLNAEEVSRVDFAAGSTEILPAADRQLTGLTDALAQRPLLGVRVQGRYAARADRAALARRQIGLHIALAASTHTNKSSAQTTLDFSDPKVQAVLDEFAAARLDASERKALIKDEPENGDEAALVTQRSYYPAVFEALAAKESVSDYALRQLARYRAHSLAGRLQELGVGTQRLSVDKRATSVISDDVPASVVLTIATYKSSDN